jgi:hypothetical protein
MVMIQYYKDLIATVTYDEVVSWLEKNQYKYQFITIKNKTCVRFCFDKDGYKNFYNCVWCEDDSYCIDSFFTVLSEALNKPIDHIVHEMKNVQQPESDNIKRLKAITNDQWSKFAEKYNLEFDIDCNDRFNIYKNGKHRLCPQYLYIRDNNLEQRRRVMDKLLFFKNILVETISEFEYAQNIDHLITELEGL